MDLKCPLSTPPSLATATATENTQQSPYYVDPANMTPLQKHCAFFDRNGDGLIMPWETYTSMRVLGYSVLLAMLGTVLIHIFFSYWTLDTWIPDPFFAIVVRNVDRLKHGSDSEVYEHDGTIQPSVHDAIVSLLTKYDMEKKGGLALTDLLYMTQRKWDVMDFFGWWAAKLEWIFLWILCQKNGLVPWNEIREQYDGTLFQKIEQERRQAGLVSS